MLLLLGTPGSATPVDFDKSMLPLCLALADTPNNVDLRAQFEAHPTNRLLAQHFSGGPPVSYRQIQEGRDRLRHYEATLPVLEATLSGLADDATEFLGPEALPDKVTIRLVCGAANDGFGFQKNGETLLFVNLAQISPDFMPHLLRHEIWHLAFRHRHKDMAHAFESAPDPLKQLAFIMLNEGVGHYYSFRRRVEPSISYTDWQERTDRLFALLPENVTALQQANSHETEAALLRSSEMGVPFWRKWGAVTGAVITYRLRQAIDTEKLKQIIVGGPCIFLTRYSEIAAQQAEWQDIPAALQAAACTRPAAR